MSKKELITLDKLLVKLQRHLDTNAIAPLYAIVIAVRRIVDREILAIEDAKEPKNAL